MHLTKIFNWTPHKTQKWQDHHSPLSFFNHWTSKDGLRQLDHDSLSDTWFPSRSQLAFCVVHIFPMDLYDCPAGLLVPMRRDTGTPLRRPLRRVLALPGVTFSERADSWVLSSSSVVLWNKDLILTLMEGYIREFCCRLMLCFGVKFWSWPWWKDI